MTASFIQLTREYLTLLDELPESELTARSFLLKCAVLLPHIYSLSHQIPDVTLLEDDSAPDSTCEKIASVRAPTRAIATLLGEWNQYSEVFDPVVDVEAITTTISDDLSDIYLDLKCPLLRYETGSDANKRVAMWEWRFNLQGHCGDHLVDVLRPIHRLIYSHLSLESESSCSDI